MSDQPTPSGARPILNANRGISNVIEQNVIETDLKRVTNNIFRVLQNHYGPYSGFAALDDSQPLNDTNFTKDGIGIVRAIEYASPQEEWVRKTIAYIGTKMESSVGDGTTSAMMFTCAMLRHMSEHLNELRPIAYTTLRNGYNAFVKLVQSVIQQHYVCEAFTKHGKDNANRVIDPEAVYHIVYNQVYTSSHGDKELAKALADMYQKTPQELWERMTYERCRYETDKNFEIVESEGQYQMNAEVFSTSMLNKDLCTWYDSPNATLIVMNDSLRSEGVDWPRIMNLIDNSSAVRPVVIVCHQQMDAETLGILNEKLDTCAKEGRPFAIFNNKPEHPKVNDYTALQVIAGVDVIKFARGEALIIDGVHVKYRAKKLSFDNLVEVPEKYHGKNERFQVTDGEHSQFTDVLEAWKNQAEWYSKQADTRQEKEQANYFNRMYIKLRYNKMYTATIGGKTYDNVAFVDVLDDAIRAASRALTHGATYGNNRALYLAVREIIDISNRADCNPEIYTPVVAWFAKRVRESLEDISEVVLERLYPTKKFSKGKKRKFVEWWFGNIVDLLQYDVHPQGMKWYQTPWSCQPVKFKSTSASFTSLKKLFAQEGGIICQPANSDIIMLERFGEVALKFILTERIIIHGGVYVDKIPKLK